MCLSTLHRVLAAPQAGQVEVEDLAGTRRVVSLLAYDGDPPAPGSWLVCHSGFALLAAEADDATAARRELRRAGPRRITPEPAASDPAPSDPSIPDPATLDPAPSDPAAPDPAASDTAEVHPCT